MSVLLAPFMVPAHHHLVRGLLTGYAISAAMKLRLLAAGQADPAMLATWPRRLLWFITPQATSWSPSPSARAATRRTAPWLFLRALTAGALVVMAAGTKARFDLTAAGWPVLTALEMFQFFLLLGALGDNAAAFAALAGARAEPLFRNPLAARSPTDFWSRRWNLVVHHFARRQIFIPLARRWGTTVGLLATFVGSGLMHEYLVVAAVGLARYQPGWMLTFFAAQGLAVLATGRVDRMLVGRWLPVAGALTQMGWLLLTSPLFFAPLRPLIEVFDARCLDLILAMLARS